MKSRHHGINNISFLIHISDILTPIIYKPKSTSWACAFCKLLKNQTTSSWLPFSSLPFSWLSSFLSSFPSWRPALQVSPVAFFVPELITVYCWRVSHDIPIEIEGIRVTSSLPYFFGVAGTFWSYTILGLLKESGITWYAWDPFIYWIDHIKWCRTFFHREYDQSNILPSLVS